MPECLHCDIIEFLDRELQGNEGNLVENAAKVIEVLSYLILIVPLKEGSALMADKAAWETIKAGERCVFPRRSPPDYAHHLRKHLHYQSRNQLMQQADATNATYIPHSDQLPEGLAETNRVHAD